MQEETSKQQKARYNSTINFTITPIAAVAPLAPPAPTAATTFSIGVISGVTGTGSGGEGGGGSVGGISAVVFISFDDVAGASLEVSDADVDSSDEVVVGVSLEELPCSLVDCGVDFEV